MIRLKIICNILLLSLLGGSCTERIDIKLDESYTRLVVDGSVTTDAKAHRVVLSKTSDYYYNKPPEMVEGAIVSISENGKIYELAESSPGIYCTDSSFYGIAGHTYILNIELNVAIGGGTEYSATSTIDPIAEVDSIGLEFHPEWSEYGIWEVKCYVLDPPTTDYYRFLISKNSKMVTDTLYEWIVTDDKFFNGNYTNGASIGFLDQGVPEQWLISGDTVTAEVNSIGKEYADFISEAQSEIWGSNPLFSGPRSNVKGNISNGAVGFFAAYSISRAVAITP